MKLKKPTITIGIPTYQAEQNIKKLVVLLTSQKTREVRIENILIYDDASTDTTYRVVKSIKNKKVKVYRGNKNRGFAYGTQFLLGRSKSDIFVLLNDDIRIDSLKTIEELVRPFIKDKNIGMTGGHIVPLPPKSFIGRCVYASVIAYQMAGMKYKSGNNMITVDGKIIALSKELYQSLDLDINNVGNVDVFLYFECLKKGLKYIFSPNAIVYYRVSEKLTDFRNQELRAIRTRRLMKKHFGSMVEKEIKIPQRIFLPSLLKAFISYPIESLFFKLIINSYYKVPKNISFKKWSLALTTKKL